MTLTEGFQNTGKSRLRDSTLLAQASQWPLSPSMKAAAFSLVNSIALTPQTEAAFSLSISRQTVLIFLEEIREMIIF